MRIQSLALIALLAGCGQPDTPKPTVSRPRPPVGLYGQWIQVAPQARAGDTLRLNADSTARGVITWSDGRLARITRWQIKYASSEPPTEREDWSGGYSDGGDAGCMSAEASGCMSLPLLCLGVTGDYLCQAFKFVAPDSLLFEHGSARYVRAQDVGKS